MKRQIDENRKVTLTLGQLKKLVKESFSTYSDATNKLIDFYVDKYNKGDFYTDICTPSWDEMLDELKAQGYKYCCDVDDGDIEVFTNGDDYYITEIRQDSEEDFWIAEMIELGKEEIKLLDSIR